MDIQQYMHDVGRHGREASRAIARADSKVKNEALRTIAAWFSTLGLAASVNSANWWAGCRARRWT